MNRSIAIAGIHTGIGKTIASAVIAEAIDADYWKPVQAGIQERDVLVVKQLLTNGAKRVHGEVILLSQPLSPHAAAEIDEIDIDHTRFVFPKTEHVLLIETAGGVLSPISAGKTMADFLSHYHLPVVLVSQNYLGSINHTLMSLEVLKSRNVPVLGIVMNGAENESSETYIERYSKVPIIGRIPFAETLDNEFIVRQAAELRPTLTAAFGI